MVGLISNQAPTEGRQAKSVTKRNHYNERMALFDQDLFIEFIS